MIDNIDIIKPMLRFDTNDDFYFLQVLMRKKENPQLGSNSRVIKNYYINNVEYLDKKYDEIKKLCEVFNARAMIRLNRRSYYKTAFKALINIANTMGNKDFDFVDKQYASACGQGHNEKVKRWIIDIDDDKEASHDSVGISETIKQCDPYGAKIIEVIPTPNGMHLITTPFNVQQFNDKVKGIDIHKDNPTNLYVPKT